MNPRSQETIPLFGDEARPSTELPVSRFPAKADRYVCDLCGRDVTRKVHRVHGHGGPIIGPTRFTCVCGARYLTGMTEWDHLGRFMRRSRMRFLVFGSAFLLPLVLFVVLARSAWDHHSPLVFALCCLAGLFSLPFAVFGILELSTVYSIFTSIWRTRFAKSDERS